MNTPRLFTAFLLAALLITHGSRAGASPFDAGRIPAEAEGVGHLDVDALRKTDVYRTSAAKVLVAAGVVAVAAAAVWMAVGAGRAPAPPSSRAIPGGALATGHPPGERLGAGPAVGREARTGVARSAARALVEDASSLLAASPLRTELHALESDGKRGLLVVLQRTGLTRRTDAFDR